MAVCGVSASTFLNNCLLLVAPIGAGILRDVVLVLADFRPVFALWGDSPAPRRSQRRVAARHTGGGCSPAISAPSLAPQLLR